MFDGYKRKHPAEEEGELGGIFRVCYNYFMKTILSINPGNISQEDQKEYKQRVAVRSVVIDESGKIALLKANKFQYHKLPGGGVEEGEEMLEALHRELKEETGCEVDIQKELGLVIEVRNQTSFIQESFCYVSKVVGKKGEPQFTDYEIGEECEVVWVDPEEAYDLILENNTTNYSGKFMVERDSFIVKYYLDSRK